MIVYFWSAEKGKKESSNPHLAEGLSHLKEAVDHGLPKLASPFVL